jgi:acetyl-CoA C-acetyltransferase
MSVRNAALIFDHVRTPRGRGRASGALHEVTPVELGAQVLRALRDRSGLETRLVDDVVMGCVMPIGEQGGNLGRIATLVAGYDESVPGQQLNRFCASGLEAVNAAAAQIASGNADLTIACGAESMSRVEMGSDGGPWNSDPAVALPIHYVPQGVAADLLATLDGYSREDVDRYACESQRRAAQAWREGHFASSVCAVRDRLGDVLLERDEHPRPGTTLEQLGRLAPAFAAVGAEGYDAIALRRYPQVEGIRHVHTAGNSSGIVDGAAAVLLGGARMAGALGRRPRARIVASASTGSEPTIMLTGPVPATRKVLARAGMAVADIDLFEVNEAFASVVLRYQRELDLDPERVNVNGGAIALGHPLGATGALLVGTALDELERRDLQTALITLCVGAGMGTATIIERV